MHLAPHGFVDHAFFWGIVGETTPLTYFPSPPLPPHASPRPPFSLLDADHLNCLLPGLNSRPTSPYIGLTSNSFSYSLNSLTLLHSYTLTLSHILTHVLHSHTLLTLGHTSPSPFPFPLPPPRPPLSSSLFLLSSSSSSCEKESREENDSQEWKVFKNEENARQLVQNEIAVMKEEIKS